MTSYLKKQIDILKNVLKDKKSIIILVEFSAMTKEQGASATKMLDEMGSFQKREGKIHGPGMMKGRAGDMQDKTPEADKNTVPQT